MDGETGESMEEEEETDVGCGVSESWWPGAKRSASVGSLMTTL